MAVISSVSTKRGDPQSALIAFAETENLELIFETQRDTRKFQNLQKNNHVSLVIGWDTKIHETLQYEGKAILLEGKELEKYRSIFLKKDTPCTEEFLFHPKVRLFKILPTWIRFSDYTGKVPKIIELYF